MAVNKPGLHWSTYQDKQLDALNSINKNLDKLTKLNMEYVDEFSFIAESHAKSLITAINDIWNDNFTDINRYVPYIHRESRRTADATEESNEQLEEIRDNQEHGNQQNLAMLRNIGDVLRSLDIEGFVRKAIDSANTYSDLYNSIIQMTGANGQESQAFRRDIVNIIEDLNDDLGSTLNPTRALEQMVAISASTSISNRETLKEIAEPILLAQETMNINVSALAELSGKLYTKYSFNSGKLERMVDSIRNSTDGQDVSEDLIVSALSRLDNNFAVYSEGDAELLEKMNMGLIKGVSFLEANYIDSQTYLNDLSDFLSPDVRDQASMVKKYGVEYAGRISAEAQAGNIDAALALMNEALDNMSIYEALARGFNRDDWMQANSDYKNLGLDALKSYESSLDESNSARETAEDKFVTIGNKITNELTGLTSYLATIQETIGIGFDDVAGLLYLSKNLGGTLGKVLGTGGSAAAGSLLGTLGPALGIGASVLGVAAIAAGIYDVVKKDNESAGDPYQDSMMNPDSAYGYGFRGVYNKDTGKTDWSYSAFESAEEAMRYDPEKAFEKYIEDTSKDRSWWQKTVDFLATRNVYDSSTDTVEAMSGYEYKQRAIYDYIQKIDSQADDIVTAFYTERDLLDELSEIKDYATHHSKYAKAYYDGIYKGETGDWYSIDGDKAVLDESKIPAFANGTNYVTKDQLALIHEGEAITPKQYNPAANMNELERLRQESDSSKDVAEMLRVVSSIKDLLETIHNENIRNTVITKNRNAATRSRISTYQLEV